MVTFAKAAKATGLISRVPIYKLTVIDYGILGPLGMDGPEGVYGTAPYLFYYPDTAANKAYVEAFRKAYGRYPQMFALFGYSAAKFIEKGFQKAGAVDKEKFINALEGMVIDSPVGNLEMRACDHQLQLPMIFGVTKKNPNFKDFLVASDIVMVPSKDFMPTCEEVLKTRK